LNHLKSPNFNERPNKSSIDILVMHYTGMKTAESALKRMCDAQAQVSAHYFIYENGDVVQLVDEDKRAWHAGISCWRGIASLNDISIGIEIANPGHEFGYEPFTEKQMDTVKELSKSIMDRHGIEARNVVGHSDIAPSRKEDPGELFDWQEIAKEGIGLWPDVKKVWRGGDVLVEPGKEDVDVARVQKMLSDYGYHIRVDGYYGSKTEDVVKAFKRHFVPEQLNVNWDKLSEERIKRLLSMIGKA
jgi:N-acetylmuramoyl-L-alanine amidase